MPHRPSTVLSEWKQRLWSSSQGNLKQTDIGTVNKEPLVANNGTKFSALVGGTISGPRGTVQRKAQASKARQHQMATQPGDFKVGEVDAGSGKRSVRSLQGVQKNSEVLYVGTFSSNGDPLKRGKLTDVFDVVDETETTSDNEDGNTSQSRASNRGGTMSRSYSQPDFLANGVDEDVSEAVLMQRPSGLFDRPMLGNLAFGLVSIVLLKKTTILTVYHIFQPIRYCSFE